MERMKRKINVKKFFTSARIILLGFLGVIFLGSGLLCLPCASNDGQSANYIDALFTSVSAVCVTGLITVDTATQWSTFGQVIVIGLIQIGGLGVITIMILLAVAFGRKISISQRSVMQDSVSAHDYGGIVKFTKFILLWTLIVELVGAILLSPVFIRDYGWGKGIWMAIFHSISAYCNAGFDLLGKEQPFSSLTSYSANPLLNVVIMLLILVGGLGFLTWHDIKTHGIHFKKYRTQSKVVLVATPILVFLPAIYFFFFEFSHLPIGERILCSLFQSVTPRTAGFNTADLTAMSETGRAVMTILMLIGGASGSTAGGMKITTFSVVCLTMFSVFRKKEDTEVFGRRLNKGTVRQAIAIFFMYISLFLLGSYVIATIENLPLSYCYFEVASAIATVGLTAGITSTLSVPSLVILMALMYFGRVGGLTLIYATVMGANKNSKLPEDKFSVG